MKQLITLRTSAILSIVTLLGVFTCPTLSKAGTLLDMGTTAPTPGAADISYLNPVTPVSNSNVYTNAIAGTFGEKFTTGTSAAAYTLNDVILQISFNYGGDGNFSLPISIKLGNVTLDSETATITGSTAFATEGGLTNHYLEFALSTPVALLANTQYSFNIGAQTGDSGGTLRIAGGNDTLSNASGFALGRTNPGDGPSPTNFVFDVGLTAVSAPVPEPSTWALMIGGLGMLVIYQRRRSKLNL